MILQLQIYKLKLSLRLHAFDGDKLANAGQMVRENTIKIKTVVWRLKKNGQDIANV